MLHGLADTDRSWLLGQLGPAQAEVLEPLLAELRELGIPADPTLAAQALGPIGAQADVQTRSAVEKKIATRTLPELQLALADEPHGAIAAILAAGNWPWQDAFLAAQEPAKARAIKEQMQSRPGGAALQRTLLQGLAQRLADIPVARTTPERGWPGFVRRLESMAMRFAPRGRA
jgi:hypothetical protein